MDAAIEMVRKSRRKIGVTSNTFVVSVNGYLRQVNPLKVKPYVNQAQQNKNITVNNFLVLHPSKSSQVTIFTKPNVAKCSHEQQRYIVNNTVNKVPFPPEPAQMFDFTPPTLR